MAHDKKEMISFYLTARCNLACIYCYTHKDTDMHKYQALNLEFAKYAIDEYYNTEYKKHIRFFGAGEPTEEFELMKDIFYYAKQKDNSTTAEIQTNGCFGANVAEWLSKNIGIVWISSDGIPQLQNHYRPTKNNKDSSPILEKNIKFLVKHTKGMVGIRMTIAEQTNARQLESVRYFEKLGIKNFWVDPIFASIGQKDTIEQIDMNKFVEEFVRTAKYCYSKGMTYGSILTCNFDEEGEYACRACIPLPHLTTDGYISACDMALFGEDRNHMDCFIYGRWDPKSKTIIYDEEKINNLQSRKLSNMKKCKNCPVGKFCRGYCLGEVVNETGLLLGCKVQICEPTLKLFEKLSDEEKKYIYSHP